MRIAKLLKPEVMLRSAASLCLLTLLLSTYTSGQSEAESEGPSSSAGAGAPMRFEAFETGGAGSVLLPRTAILPHEVAVVMDENRPFSVEIGEYYALERGIPAANRVYVAIPPPTQGAGEVIGTDEYLALKAEIDAALANRPDIQALVLAWKFPYTVDGFTSITSALGLGGAFVNAWGDCDELTPPQPPSSPFYDDSSTMPFTDHGIRPAMALATVEQSRDELHTLIARGLAADGGRPAGHGYLFRTSDSARSVRWSDMKPLPERYAHQGGLSLSYEDNSDPQNPRPGGDFLRDAADVLFYFTGHHFEGQPAYSSIHTNGYLPGAIADHLTSAGGVLHPRGSQLKITQWIRAGATASYGTVMEPCAFTSKFPRVSILIDRYFAGGSVIDSYWRSVLAPSQGLFIGEPLARPWAPSVAFDSGGLVITTTLQEPGQMYVLESAPAPTGPWTWELVVDAVEERSLREIRIPGASPDRHYRLFPDVVPPTTPPYFHVALQCGTDPARLFYWGDASDDVELAGYRLYRNCGGLRKLVGSTTENSLWAELECEGIFDGEGEVEISFYVTAVDGSGNESAPSPSIVLQDVPR